MARAWRWRWPWLGHWRLLTLLLLLLLLLLQEHSREHGATGCCSDQHCVHMLHGLRRSDTL